MKKILISGGSGFFAINWFLKKKNFYDVTLLLNKYNLKINTKHIFTDICSYSKLNEVVNKVRPDIIINTAAITNIETCEKNKRLASQVNYFAAKNISKICEKKNIHLVHLSTDHLFDGKKKFYTERSYPSPLNNYGITKLKAENIIKKNKNACIVRKNFFGWAPKYRKSFSDFVIFSLKQKKKIYLFDDVFITPIHINYLISSIDLILKNSTSGIFNICGSERISKFSFGKKIAKKLNLNLDLINKTSISNFSNMVVRPHDMSLSNKKFINSFNTDIPSLEQQMNILKKEYCNKSYLKIKNII